MPKGRKVDPLARFPPDQPQGCQSLADLDRLILCPGETRSDFGEVHVVVSVASSRLSEDRLEYSPIAFIAGCSALPTFCPQSAHSHRLIWSSILYVDGPHDTLGPAETPT